MVEEQVKLVEESEICRICKNIVIGKGNKDAVILFVGEAPGKNED